MTEEKKRDKEEPKKDCRDDERTDRDAKKARKCVRITYGAILLVFILLVILAAVIMAISMFISSQSKNSDPSNSDIGNYLAIFSILFTLLALSLPLTSYIINKDEVKKINDSVDKRMKAADESVMKNIKESRSQIERVNAKHSQEMNTKVSSLNVRYVELLECIVRRNSMVFYNENDPYIHTSLDFVNALFLFENGSYDYCKTYIIEAIDKLDDLLLDNDGESGRKEDRALLIYKLFDLFRKVSGRTRSFDDLLCTFANFRAKLEKQSEKDESIYQGILYLYIKTQLDNTEKTFVTEEEKLQEMKNMLKSIYEGVEFYALSARINFVEAYYYGRRSCYEGAVRFAQKGEKLYEQSKKNLKKSELEQLKETDSIYTIARVFEKVSFSKKKGDERNKLLDSAYRIVDRLIEEKPSAKYYLELSEILKKRGNIIESDRAAQYGFQMAPCDPLLAAQCAYMFLRKYLETHKVSHIGRAEECIEIAYWIYKREKERYDSKVNVKFSYIASLYALIKTFVLMDVCGALESDEKNAMIERIVNALSNSITDNPNNVPNYKRMFMVYSQLYEKDTTKEGKTKYYKEVLEHIKEFQANSSFKDFNENDDFYGFSKAVSGLDLGVPEEELMKTIRKIVEPFENHI